MDKIKAAVLIELDEHQKEELEAAGKDMVEFVYVPEDMSREERLPLLKQAQIIPGCPKMICACFRRGTDHLWTARDQGD